MKRRDFERDLRAQGTRLDHEDGRDRRYLIERALTAGESDALTADYLAQAAHLGDCPMRTSLVARALEAIR